MVDIVDKETRSKIMSKIHSKGTKSEIALKDALIANGITDFKMHYEIMGKPDFAFLEIKLAVFCDSLFWHGKKSIPETNRAYWLKKFEKNRERDRKVNQYLKKNGWQVLRINEDVILKNPTKQANRIKKIAACVDR